MPKMLKVRLGQEVFVLSDENNVVRTAICEIRTDGSYGFFNGQHSLCRHWFTYEEAVNVAKAKIAEHIKILRNVAKKLSRKSKYLDMDEVQQEVRTSPYKVVSYDGPEARRRTRKLKKIVVPKKYIKPGNMVYAVITPQLFAHVRNQFFVVYRPYEYFVLETMIKSVSFSPDGVITYTYTTPFVLKEVYGSRKEAEDKLRCFIDNCSEVKIPFVSHQEEKEKLDEMMEDSIPF